MILCVSCNHAVSDGFIIGISVVGVVIAMVCFLNMVAVGGIKVKPYCDQHFTPLYVSKIFIASIVYCK